MPSHLTLKLNFSEPRSKELAIRNCSSIDSKKYSPDPATPHKKDLIPEWVLIWNTKMYPWGVNWDAKAAREDAHDILSVTVPAETIDDVVEQFTIRFSSSNELILEWDHTRVRAQIGS